MTLNSILFIFTCLPILLIVYHYIPSKYRNRTLIIASLVFYAWGEPLYVFLLLLSMWYSYRICIKIDEVKDKKQRKGLFIQAIVIHVFFLIYLKYYGFILESVKLLFHLSFTYQVLPQPLGVSFYTFMMVSYIIDVYTHKTKAEKDLEKFAVYVTFFPKLIMGPIERYSHMKKQIAKPSYDTAHFALGVERFIKGLAKKVILADTLGMIWNEVSVITIPELSIMTAWIGAFAYTLQIYFDFSGYSDMAIGIGHMFGFTFMENFNYPYIATSIQDFWRRWHISLSTWFRDYIYIPLGGNRVDRNRHIINIMIVWTLTGFWHGASWNFIIWGMYYGLLLLLEKYVFKKYLIKLQKPWQWLITFILIMAGWVLFAITDITKAIEYLAVMFGVHGNPFIDMQAEWFIMSNGILFIIALVNITPWTKHMLEICKQRKPEGEYFVLGLYFLLLLVAMAYLVSQSYQSFLYTQF